MVYRPNIDEQLCFVLMPFQDLHQQYFKGILEPAVESLGLKARKADDIYGTTAIVQDIWQLIWSAKFVIADVTNKNPNVNYELGICHALGVPTILITQDMADVPFDYKHLRCIVYDTRQVDWQEKLGSSITKTIKALLDGAPVADDLRWPYDTHILRRAGQSGPFISADEARETLAKAIRQGGESISKAFGVHGTSVSTLSQFGPDKSYRSGVAIASALASADPLTQQGLELIKAISREAEAELGDGTKSATLIFCEMVSKGFSQVRKGIMLRDLVHEMDVAVEAATSYLQTQLLPGDYDSSFAVAMTSALGDGHSGAIVHDAISSARRDGVVLIEDSMELSTSLSVREGMYFERGFLSKQFITDEPRQLAVLEDAYILLCSERLASMHQLLPVLEQIAHSHKPLLIVAENVEGEALATLVTNQLKGTLRTVAVRSPGQASRQEVLEDIAIATGGTVIGYSTRLEQTRLSQLGQADRIEVSSGSTWIIGARGDRELLESRAAGIRQQISVVGTDFDKARLQDRLAKLIGATAVIRVGGASFVDRDERKYRIETSLNSTRSAIASGAIPGGGSSLWRASKHVREKCQNVGGSIVADALAVPLYAQIENARASRDGVLSLMESDTTMRMGFNALKLNVTDIVKDGVLDSSHIIVRGLQIAFAHARKVLQTGAWEIGPSVASS